jgi:hypothetical protein
MTNPDNEDIEERLYEMVAAEIAAGEYKPGLQAKSIALTDGDQNRANALYIKWRVEQLAKEVAPELELQQAPRVTDPASIPSPRGTNLTTHHLKIIALGALLVVVVVVGFAGVLKIKSSIAALGFGGFSTFITLMIVKALKYGLDSLRPEVEEAEVETAVNQAEAKAVSQPPKVSIEPAQLPQDEQKQQVLDDPKAALELFLLILGPALLLIVIILILSWIF